mgnify:CR=1 FL=1
MLSPLQPSAFLQVFATIVLLQEYIGEAGDVWSYCNEGFATRVLLRKIKKKFCIKGFVAKNREKYFFCNRVLLRYIIEEKILQQRSCYTKLEKKEFCNMSLLQKVREEKIFQQERCYRKLDKKNGWHNQMAREAADA